MERAGQQYTPEIYSDSEDWDTDTCFDFDLGPAMSTGKAIFGLGAQITPMETPMVENARGTRDVDVETRRGFLQGTGKRSPFLELSDRRDVSREPFPVYVEPGMAFGS